MEGLQECGSASNLRFKQSQLVSKNCALLSLKSMDSDCNLVGQRGTYLGSWYAAQRQIASLA